MDFLVLLCALGGESFRDDTVHAFTDESYIRDLQIAKIGFRGPMTLHPRAERFAQEKAEDSEKQRERQQEESPADGTRALERQIRHRTRKECRRHQVGPAARMDSEFLFAGTQAPVGFIKSRTDIAGGKLPKDKETGWVGMPTHVDFVGACQHMKRGVFERVVAPCFKDIR